MIKLLSADDKVAEIKRLYYATTRATIHEDLAKAINLLKSMSSEEERERVAVYMDGLAQMRSEWARAGKSQGESRKSRGDRRKEKSPGDSRKSQGKRRKEKS